MLQLVVLYYKSLCPFFVWVWDNLRALSYITLIPSYFNIGRSKSMCWPTSYFQGYLLSGYKTGGVIQNIRWTRYHNRLRCTTDVQSQYIRKSPLGHVSKKWDNFTYLPFLFRTVARYMQAYCLSLRVLNIIMSFIHKKKTCWQSEYTLLESTINTRQQI